MMDHLSSGCPGAYERLPVKNSLLIAIARPTVSSHSSALYDVQALRRTQLCSGASEEEVAEMQRVLEAWQAQAVRTVAGHVWSSTRRPRLRRGCSGLTILALRGRPAQFAYSCGCCRRRHSRSWCVRRSSCEACSGRGGQTRPGSRRSRSSSRRPGDRCNDFPGPQEAPQQCTPS